MKKAIFLLCLMLAPFVRAGHPKAASSFCADTYGKIAETNLDNSKQVSGLLRQISADRLQLMEINPSHLDLLEQTPFPFHPTSILATGGEKVVFDLGDGRILKMTVSPPQALRSFDVPHLGGGKIESGKLKLHYWSEPKLMPVTLEELCQFEKEVLTPNNYGIMDMGTWQFGKDASGKVYLLDQDAVKLFKKDPPRTAQMVAEYKKLLKQVEARSPDDPDIDLYVQRQRRQLIRIGNLAPQSESGEADDLYRAIEERLRDLEYPVDAK